MGLRDAVRWLKRKIKGRKTAQEQQEETIQEPEENRIPEEETEPQEPETEAQEQAENTLPEAEQNETRSTSLEQALASFGISVEQATERIIQAMEIFREAFLATLGIYSLDKWQREKLKMSNNERRRRGLPMVRRQQHLRNLKNQRRKKKKPPEKVKYKTGVCFREERTRL